MREWFEAVAVVVASGVVGAIALGLSVWILRAMLGG